MKFASDPYHERLTRITQAITLGKPDRVPVMALIDAWAATYRNGSMAKLSDSILYSNKLILETIKDFPQLDMIEVSAALPRIVAAGTLSTVKVAGKQLPEGSLWQVEEEERMTEADYDRIIKIGWKSWKKEYYKKFLNLNGFDIFKTILGGMACGRRCRKAGIPEFSTVFANIPLDPLAGGRGMAKFTTDLFRMPDKIKEVMDIMIDDIIDDMKNQIKAAKPFSIFFGVARGSSGFISPKLFDKFTWPYVLKITNAAVDSGAFVNLHFDGDWNRDIERFKELPKGKCVWSSDNATDIFKLRAVLDGHMCIKGDVPPALLALGTPDEVYNYSSKLIKDLGPTGFILAPACTTPYNTIIDNFKAMISAATGQ